VVCRIQLLNCSCPIVAGKNVAIEGGISSNEMSSIDDSSRYKSRSDGDRILSLARYSTLHPNYSEKLQL
jgi:hypothetical protein